MNTLLKLGLAAAMALTLTGACESTGGAPPPPPASAPGAEGGICGGIAGFQCGAGLQCHMTPEMQRIPDGAGVCRKPPRLCTQQYDPVCGVDGKTYGNGCTASVAGVRVAHKGACAR
ncbi:MAG: Kazal-type serine protease inhibitor family protein [Caulobacter sp.]|nr:Kazal-type serine protease inhibitor family protein [Caulobacter sp.]